MSGRRGSRSPRRNPMDQGSVHSATSLAKRFMANMKAPGTPKRDSHRIVLEGSSHGRIRSDDDHNHHHHQGNFDGFWGEEEILNVPVAYPSSAVTTPPSGLHRKGLSQTLDIYVHHHPETPSAMSGLTKSPTPSIPKLKPPRSSSPILATARASRSRPTTPTDDIPSNAYHGGMGGRPLPSPTPPPLPPPTPVVEIDTSSKTDKSSYRPHSATTVASTDDSIGSPSSAPSVLHLLRPESPSPGYDNNVVISRRNVGIWGFLRRKRHKRESEKYANLNEDDENNSVAWWTQRSPPPNPALDGLQPPAVIITTPESGIYGTPPPRTHPTWANSPGMRADPISLWYDNNPYPNPYPSFRHNKMRDRTGRGSCCLWILLLASILVALMGFGMIFFHHYSIWRDARSGEGQASSVPTVRIQIELGPDPQEMGWSIGHLVETPNATISLWHEQAVGSYPSGSDVSMATVIHHVPIPESLRKTRENKEFLHCVFLWKKDPSSASDPPGSVRISVWTDFQKETVVLDTTDQSTRTQETTDHFNIQLNVMPFPDVNIYDGYAIIPFWQDIGETIPVPAITFDTAVVRQSSVPLDEDDHFFSKSMAFSRDGTVLAVGSHKDRGVAQVFQLNASIVDVSVGNVEDASWIKKGEAIRGSFRDDHFAEALALSPDGNVLAIGAKGHPSAPTASNLMTTAEAAGYVQIYSWENRDEQWIPMGDTLLQGDFKNGERGFGTCVALSDDGHVLAVGVLSSVWTVPISNDSRDVSEAPTAGVRVYRFDDSKSQWLPYGRPLALVQDDTMLSSPDGTAASIKVSLSSDGTIVAAGILSTSHQRRFVRAFRYDGGQDAWVRLGHVLVGKNGQQNSNIFGQSVSLSADGMRLAIGAPLYVTGGLVNSRHRQGYVQVYQLDPDHPTHGLWRLMGFTFHGDHPLNVHGQRDYNFGWDVSLSADGETLAVSVPPLVAQDTGTKQQDSADLTPAQNATGGFFHLYRYSEDDGDKAFWSDLGPEIPSNAGTVASSVALSGDGFVVATKWDLLQEDSGIFAHLRVYTPSNYAHQ